MESPICVSVNAREFVELCLSSANNNTSGHVAVLFRRESRRYDIVDDLVVAENSLDYTRRSSFVLRAFLRLS